MKKRKKKSHSTGAKGRSLSGRIQLHSDGFAFLIPDIKGEKDVFIPAPYTGGVMDGDRAEVSVHSRSGRRKQEGRVEKVLERSQTHVVGRFEVTPGGFRVICESGRNFLRVKVAPDKAMNASSGDTVAVLITHYPEKDQALQGEVVRILGNRKEPLTETEILIIEHQLKTQFPSEVIGEAKQFSEEVSEEELAVRKDLRSFPIITIDGENARDFDDGVWVKKIPAGFRLYVAIADVSHYVRLGTALNREALSRATSVYFPDRCIPMLPEELSNHLCSLVPHRDRLSFVGEMDFDTQGKRVGSSFYKAIIQAPPGRLIRRSTG